MLTVSDVTLLSAIFLLLLGPTTTVDKDVPTEVSVQLYIHSVDSFNEAAMDYSLTVFVRQKWEDLRLSYASYPTDTELLELDSRIMERVWVPDLYFTNEKTAEFHLVTVPNKLMHLYRNGTVFYSVRLSMTLSCMMNLEKYPMDSQVCNIIAESYSYTTEYLEFKWYNGQAIDYSQDLVIPQFERKETIVSDCTKTYGQVGNFTCIKARIHLQRNIWYYIVQIYIPSLLIVILSWVSFWLDVDAIPARITLGVLTVLTLTTQSSSVRTTLPKVSYIKAIDVWMAICLGFVFAGLLEFAFVNVLTRRKKNEVNAGNEYGSTAEIARVVKVSDIKANSKSLQTGRRRALALDKLSRLIFPTVFIIFNILYWLFYTIWLK